MSLSRIYIDTLLDLHRQVELNDSTAHYIKHVLRLQVGQQLILFNGREAADYISTVDIQKKKVLALPVEKRLSGNESAMPATLLQAVGKTDHIDYLLQKTTELGVSQIILFNSERTQIHLKADRLQKKITHWKKIMISACQQSGRNRIPQLDFYPSLADCLQSLPASGNRIMLHFDGDSLTSLKETFNNRQTFYMLVGAEGGFTDSEASLAKQSGFSSCLLGPRTLRMETAAICIVNLLQHHYGDMR